MSRREIPAIVVHQWIREWETVGYDTELHRSKPSKELYVFSLSAPELKALSGIQRRSAVEPRPGKADLGIQRRHQEERSNEIRSFFRNGYPWSVLSKAKRESGKYQDLRNPGWLPTAIIVNILAPGPTSRGTRVYKEDSVAIGERNV